MSDALFESFEYRLASEVDFRIFAGRFIDRHPEPNGASEVGYRVEMPNGWVVKVIVPVVGLRQVMTDERERRRQHHDFTIRAKKADVVVYGPSGEVMEWNGERRLRDQPIDSVLSLIRMVAKEGSA